MAQQKMNIIIEKAKDNNLTCKIENSNSEFIYAYSKYKPKDKISLSNLNFNSNENLILLGLGLGYELEYLAKNTNNYIYVIEPDKEFYNIILSSNELNSVLKIKNIKFLFGDEYKKLTLSDYEIVNNKNITCYNSHFYIEVLNYLSRFP
ncbi:hypothetical protein [Desulfosporosinus acidiphilus]|nr:hypothetical protein [Desulfosporosinus acidiphilus]